MTFTECVVINSLPLRPAEYLKTFGLGQSSVGKIKQLANGRFTGRTPASTELKSQEKTDQE